jgi:imidazolonepropionase-like amidohydrolase
MVENGTYLDGTIYYYFPPKIRADIAANPVLFKKWLSSRNNFKNVFDYALESGVRYTVASDGASAIMLWEIEILVRVFGVSPLDAIKAGTMSSADCCGILNEVGTLEPGKYADIIAVKNNPLEDIKALMNVSYLMKAGRQYNWASGKFEDPGGPWS